MKFLQEFAKNIWLAQGPIVRDMGLYFTTRMTIVKLKNGALWIESPVEVADDVMKEIFTLGQVRYLVTATPRHFWRLAAWHERFPKAELWACRRTSMTLGKDVLPLAGTLGDVPPEAWSADFEQMEFKGNSQLSEVLFFHRGSRTLILDDLIMRNPALPGKPLTNFAFRLEGARHPDGGVPLDMKMTFFKRDLARQSLERLLSWDFDRLIIAHGDCIETGAKEYVKKAFSWLEK